MTSGPRSRPVADGGSHDAGLFESFPDPLVAYAKGDRVNESEGEPGTDRGRPIVHRVNPAFEAAFGVEDDNVVGIPLDELRLEGSDASDGTAVDATGGTDLSETDGDGTGPGTGTAASAGALLGRLETDAAAIRFSYGTDGGVRHFRVREVATGDADERGYLLFTDVTESERRRRDLAETVTRLERLGSVARHDLRNPLDVARIRLEAARDTGEEVHFEKVAGALDRIERIAEEVLDVGGGDVDPTDEVALEGVVEAAWETVDTTDAALVVRAGLPTVRADAGRLRGLFENLFRNSVEHGTTDSRPEAGDSVEHGGRDVTVTVEPLPDGFAVSDDGPGIPADVRERVFEAGYSTASGNSGLGLSIVRRIGREHGWRVSLGSGGEPQATDAGARFEFTGVETVGGADDPGEADGTDEPDGAGGSGGARPGSS